MDKHHRPLRYEIRVERYLGPAVAALFPEFEHSEDNGCTVMRGTLPDQSALHGVLARIRDLGLTLVALNRLDDDRPDADLPGDH